jgi:hypothetical protein
MILGSGVPVHMNQTIEVGSLVRMRRPNSLDIEYLGLNETVVMIVCEIIPYELALCYSASHNRFFTLDMYELTLA